MAKYGDFKELAAAKGGGSSAGTAAHEPVSGEGGYFYQDEDKTILREELLTDKAKEWAESFIRPADRPELRSAQLRRFYSDVKALEAKVKAAHFGFDRTRPLIKMLKSKVAYACPTRGDRKVPQEFRGYIEEMVDSIHDRKDFEGFALCFEAVVGFFYGQGGRT